jgi:Leucine-rich repeat (LRR) protein
MSHLSSLRQLSLNSNQLDSLPAELRDLPNLRQLSLDNNLLETLPPEIGNLAALELLSLAGNHLTALPPEIGQLSRLNRLKLGGNQLATLPDEIANLQSLVYLDLSFNNFRHLPTSLAALTVLRNQMVNCSLTITECGLNVNENPLISPPEEVLDRGTSAILAYLRNEAWWHLQKLIAGGVSILGLVTLSILGLRWKNRRGKQKRKNAEV